MLTAGVDANATGAYVPLERVTGLLGGCRGAFALMHAGTQSKGGDRHSRVTVVPGCGTGQFKNLSGIVSIEIPWDSWVHF